VSAAEDGSSYTCIPRLVLGMTNYFARQKTKQLRLETRELKEKRSQLLRKNGTTRQRVDPQAPTVDRSMLRGKIACPRSRVAANYLLGGGGRQFAGTQRIKNSLAGEWLD